MKYIIFILAGFVNFYSSSQDVFEAVRIGDWKFIETNYSYTWPIPLEHPNYATKEFVPTYYR